MENRIELAEYFNQLGFKVGAEIGVLEGKFSEKLCQIIPSLTLHCIDTWGLNEIRYRKYHERKHKSFVERFTASPYRVIPYKDLSSEAVKHFAFDSLDFVYIDANHKFNYIVQDLIEWTRRVRVGGIVSGDDYGKESIRDAVTMYCKHNNLKVRVLEDETWYFTR